MDYRPPSHSEVQRLQEARDQAVPWKQWGPYLSERQWGTVREDYSESGDAWNYFTHDQARSRAYRWGEDGIAGISDDRQLLCFALALWNGQDAILKERLFGLTNSEGNHGEDVKEYYFYLDNTPTHSYMRYLYKYPQSAFPYSDLVAVNRSRGRAEFEYEPLDTGVFDQDRYFDIFVEYAKDAPNDILIKITACNRGPEAKTLHILPTLWFRNTWQWIADAEKPALRQSAGARNASVVEARHTDLGTRYLYCEGNVPLLFTENETNNRRLFGGENLSPYMKDGINDTVVDGAQDAVNPQREGTKAAAHYCVEIGAGSTAVIRLRLRDTAHSEPFADFDETVDMRRAEADDFYRVISPSGITADTAQVMRQALAGMLWTKQYYEFDVNKWLLERSAHPAQPKPRMSRNQEWAHMLNGDIISMPDKWEYPRPMARAMFNS